MKLSINKGVSYKNAIDILSEFLQENFSDYPILKNTMNIYITLKNSDNQICPDNEKEYILNQDGQVKDVLEDEKTKEFTKRMREWNSFINSYENKISRLEKQVNTDINYLETAKEKGRKEENITKRKIQLDKNKLELKRVIKYFEIIKRLDKAIDNNNFTTLFLKQTHRSPYKYNLDAIFIFEDVESYTGYFDWHGLHDGKPEYL